MGSYQMNVGVGVTGAEQLDRLGTSTERQEQRVRRVDDAIKQYAASNDRLNAKLLDIEKSELRLEQLREQHRMQTERLAAATDKQTAAQERLNQVHRSTVTDVQAASASIRAFEGNLPIRAVEQFTTKMLGLGSVFQMAFPIVGAIALVEALEKGGEKLVKLYDKYVELKDVQDEVVKGARELAGEYENAAFKLDRYLIQSLRDQKRYREAAQIETRDIQSTPIRLPQIDKEKLSGLSSYQQQLVTGAYSEIIPADIPRRISTIENRLHTLNLDLEDYAAGGPVRVNAPSQRQAELEKQFYENLLPVLGIEKQRADAEGKAAGDRASKDEAKEAERLTREREKVEEHILELRKKAEEAAMRSYFGNSLEGRAAYDQVRLRIEENDAVRKDIEASRAAGVAPSTDQIRGYYTILRASAYGDRNEAIRQRDTREALELDQIGKSWLTGMNRADRPELQEGERAIMDVLNRLPLGMQPPAGYRSPAQEMRDVRDSERRYFSLAGVQAQLSGQSERDQIDSQYGARLRFAEQEYRAALKLADLKKSEADKDAARADALDQKNQKIFDAQMEREKAVLEMVVRQKQEFERNFVSMIHAAASGHLGAYVLGKLEEAGDKILMKIAGKIFDRIYQHGQQGVSIADVLGGAAKSASDVVDSNDRVVAADDRLVAALDRVTAVILSGSGGGGGVPTIGFPNGSGGPGVMTTTGSVIKYGFPGSGSGGGSGTMSSVGRIASYAGAAGLGYDGARNISRGGAKNVAGGISEVAMAASMVDPEPVSKAVLAAVAITAGFVSAIMGDPKAERQRQINNTLAFSRYIDPVSINASMTTYGGYADYDRFGGIRSSDFSPFPFIQPGYRDPLNNNAVVPGRTTGQFGNGPVVIYAMDGEDVKRVLTRHSDALGDAVVYAKDRGHTALQEAFRGQ